MTSAVTTGYLAAAGFEAPLVGALRNVTETYGRLIIADGPPQPRAVMWAENIWYEPQHLTVRSIGDAAATLKSLTRNWWPYPWTLHRRMLLIAEKLPHVSAKPLVFPQLPPAAPLGSYFLTSPNTLLASARCSSPFPGGVPLFAEFKVGPPSRAYLKLWELFTRVGRCPAPGELCLDLGASPGGWTWVLATLGAKVQAYDRAELAANVSAMPGVTSVRGDAFAATPERVGKIDWLCSDVICYPEKLLEHVQLWLTSGLCNNFVCTLKFQGTGHYGVIDAFSKISHSQLLHLHNNKHELTWVRIAPPLSSN